MSKKILWIASYPKSGNTFMRSLLSSLIYTDSGEFNFNLLKKVKQFDIHLYFKFIKMINEGLYNQAKYSKEKKEILDFLDNHRSDFFSPKEIANGLGKKTTREVNNVTRLLRKLLAAGDILQPKEIKGKYRCIPF